VVAQESAQAVLRLLALWVSAWLAVLSPLALPLAVRLAEQWLSTCDR